MTDRSPGATPEQAPVANERPAVWDLVVEDMRARDAEGARKYGTRLQPDNGRDALTDAYQECLDQAVYLRQRIEEERGAMLTLRVLGPFRADAPGFGLSVDVQGGNRRAAMVALAALQQWVGQMLENPKAPELLLESIRFAEDIQKAFGRVGEVVPVPQADGGGE